jgi:hypothetical protein
LFSFSNGRSLLGIFLSFLACGYGQGSQSDMINTSRRYSLPQQAAFGEGSETVDGSLSPNRPRRTLPKLSTPAIVSAFTPLF